MRSLKLNIRINENLSYICNGHLTNEHLNVYEFIENITEALRGDLALFNKYLTFIDVDNTRIDYKALELPGTPVTCVPTPHLVES